MRSDGPRKDWAHTYAHPTACLVVLVHLLTHVRLHAYSQADRRESEEESTDLNSLEALLRSPRHANACLKCIRSLVGRHMLLHAQDYEPFINGCGP